MASLAQPAKVSWQLFHIKREDWAILALTCAIIAVVAVLTRFNGFWYVNNLRFYAMIVPVVLLGETTVRLIKDRPDSPFAYFRAWENWAWLPKRLAASLPIVALALFMPAFSTMKSSISMFSTFDWDTTFIAWDRTIHGTDVWLLLQPVMGYPAVTWAASTIYHLWFGLIYFGPFLFGYYVADRELRLRFFLSYLGSWTIVGMIFATLLASVGPVFAEPILGIDTFRAQTDYLAYANSVYPIAVVDVQAMLLDWYQAGDYGLGRGITAMPSMHVALAWLYVLAMWQIDRRLGIAFAVFFVGIMLSSVHLAYHYAVDGYVAIALVTMVWWGAGKIAGRLVQARPEEVTMQSADK